MIYPKFLNKNDTISLVAPSFGAFIEPYHTNTLNAVKEFKRLGFNVIETKNTYGSCGLLSAPPKECAKEVEDAIFDSSKLMLSVGGGEMMISILQYINFDNFKKNPKWFMGFSDNTNLTFPITTMCDIATIYGPNAGSFGELPWEGGTLDAFKLIKGEKLEFNSYDRFQTESLRTKENPFAKVNLDTDSIKTFYPTSEVSFKGRMLGGCLDCLNILCGTKYDHVKEFIEKYKDDGIIWYLEACEFNTLQIKRVLIQLKEAGWFKYVKGFIFGRPLTGMEDYFGLSRFDAVKDVVGELGVPIIFDFDIGHMPPMMPIINGAICDVKNHGNDVVLKYELK